MIKIFSHSEAGGHEVNEDAFQGPPFDQEGWLCAIADGQGGRAGGAEAAKLACTLAIGRAMNHSAKELLRPRTWIEILHIVDKAVADDPKAGFTTLIGFFLTNSTICGASSGDSAAILIGSEHPRTVLTDGQHKNPPVGSGAATFISFGAKLANPWIVAAMTDGVWKYAGWDNIIRMLVEVQNDQVIPSIREKAQLARTGKLQDDFTLVVFREDAI